MSGPPWACRSKAVWPVEIRNANYNRGHTSWRPWRRQNVTPLPRCWPATLAVTDDGNLVVGNRESGSVAFFDVADGGLTLGEVAECPRPIALACPTWPIPTPPS